MTLSGDLNAYLTNYINEAATREEIVENIFDWLLSADVLSRVGKVCNIEDYIVAINELKDTQL